MNIFTFILGLVVFFIVTLQSRPPREEFLESLLILCAFFMGVGFAFAVSAPSYFSLIGIMAVIGFLVLLIYLKKELPKEK